MAEYVRHFQMLSYCKSNNLKPYYITTIENELIEFKNKDNIQLQINYLTIEAVDTPIYFSPNDGTEVIYIAAGQEKIFSYQSQLEKIRLYVPQSTKIRWYAQAY